VKVLVICRPVPGTEITAMASHLPEEARHLAGLREAGMLLEAYSPGGPGAVLILEVPDTADARSIAESLPLRAAGLIETELIGLHPLSF